MTIHMQNNLPLNTFAATVSSGDVVLVLANAIPDRLDVDEGDTVLNEYAYATTLTSVTLQVLDAASYTMEVFTNSSGTAWPRPSGTSQTTVLMPAAGGDVALTMMIVARDGGGAVAARRSQVVIIKHKPNP